MKDVRAAVNGTKNDLAKLKRTVTTVKILMFLLNRFLKYPSIMVIFNSENDQMPFPR